MAERNFYHDRNDISAPARRLFAITPDDATDLVMVTRGIYVGGAGNLEVVTEQGDTEIFVAVPTGTILPVMAVRVRAANTTATSLVGMT